MFNKKERLILTYINFRLIITSGKNVYNTMINRKLGTSMMKEFTSARKLFQKSNFCGSALTENIVSPSKIIEESKESKVYNIAITYYMKLYFSLYHI